MTDSDKPAPLKARASARYQEARERVEKAAATGKAKADEAAKTARQSAKRATTSAAKGIEQNPVVALVGGLALGAIAAALLPRTTREDKLVGPVGKAARNRATKAVAAARDTAKSELSNLGISADTAKAQFRDIASKVGQAAQVSASAAAKAAKKK